MAGPGQEACQILAVLIRKQHGLSGQGGRKYAALVLAVRRPQGSFSRSEVTGSSRGRMLLFSEEL